MDAISWRSLQDNVQQPLTLYQQPKSADNLLHGHQVSHHQHHTNDTVGRHRAQPQEPSHRKMGRRASEGSMLSGPYEYTGGVVSNSGDMVVGSSKMKSVSKEGQNVQTLGYPNTAGCRLSLDGGRRESSSSLASSAPDSSKDSLSSFESTSTLTGQDTDDSIIMTR